MFAIFSVLLSNWRLVAAGVGVVAILGAGVYIYNKGYQMAREEQLEQSVKALRDRKKTDETIHNLSDADLCRSLGGVPDDNGKCV